MPKPLVVVFLLISLTHYGFSQCIDRGKIKLGGDYGFINFIRRCPTYSFAYGGDTSKNWNVLDNPIDIKQAPVNALKFKKNVESKVENYAGDNFFSNLKFISVDIVYPEKLKQFIHDGRTDVTLKYYKAKYFYYYQFKPDTSSAFLIGIAVRKDGKILSPFMFPSKNNYKAVDKNFTYCKLINIARTVQKNIDPIESISLEFDTKSQRFVWMISQAVVKSHEGDNFINQVFIDAADLSQTEKSRTHVHIVY
jgi:hypothetical protein